ncbi:ABC transporter ATP-binding protein/permease [Atopobium sp. oral taxon 199]|uniref:ABC transporter ATP-binding protein/permease n=1 Tax=Atopobium sp. oral taxon 199 TaxID=712156 RepID=UPI00034E8583|nr:ABC transporter ATP-binding protein/permease [Atopobium sp. oral taxon 199]EPD77417.1 ATP-binding cassette, subfamily C, bacterial [Atopobium sp. oral taxon 199 str. F0494]
MFNKRLIAMIGESKKYIAAHVALQWISLLANIVMMWEIAHLLQSLYEKTLSQNQVIFVAVIAAIAVIVRFVCSVISSRMAYLSSKSVKKILRENIYKKLLRLGSSYNEQVQTSEVVQVAVEGVDQLETYFGQYLPQFFYALLAPLTLFVALGFVNLPSAAVLLICVPLIPLTIVAVQRFAKKLLAKYWGRYTALGDTFLENLQGLTTAKIYQADEFKHNEMNEQAEQFRRITMKVLTMQLNSITVMDLIAYGGAALGVGLAVTQFQAGAVDLAGCLLIILLAADFFLPMRMLGSFFHIAMNGMAASEKIFRLLDLPEAEAKTGEVPTGATITCRDVHYSYESEREILHGIDMAFPKGSFTALVGESGCGKSTIASILMGRNKGYEGAVLFGDRSLTEISEASLMQSVTYVGHQSYLFKGTVRDNLLMACSTAQDETFWRVLEQVNLAGFLQSEKGLDMKLDEMASNLSGGQRQRLALARALLHDSPVYIFDEATSNIDVESENDIIAQIHALAKKKTVILISHRLANVTDADKIYVLDQGSVVEEGVHEDLLAKEGTYARLWGAQQELERYAQGGDAA